MVRVWCKFGGFFVTLRNPMVPCRDQVTVVAESGETVTDPVVIDRVLRLFAYDNLAAKDYKW